ncbi:hypothetical protein HRbin15_00282 [bacterium HR15]|nr:hypothetical protein HRbin15_00282 [bacterium HR15]
MGCKFTVRSIPAQWLESQSGRRVFGNSCGSLEGEAPAEPRLEGEAPAEPRLEGEAPAEPLKNIGRGFEEQTTNGSAGSPLQK